MKYLLITLLSFFIYSVSFGQEITDQVKGNWIISKFQGAGESGITYQLAQMFVGDTITINNFIRQSLEENEYIKAAGISPVRCEFHPINTQKIEDTEKHFSDKFKLKPILLGIKEPSSVFLIKTDCSDRFFKEIYFDVNNNKLFLYTEGMVFILDRIEQ